MLWLSLPACRRREMQAGNESRKTPDFLYVPEAITEKALLLPLYNEAAGGSRGVRPAGMTALSLSRV